MSNRRIVVITIILTAIFLMGGFFVGRKVIHSELTKKVVRKAKSFIYYGATKYNPEGDTLPDWIDDVIMGKIKEIF